MLSRISKYLRRFKSHDTGPGSFADEYSSVLVTYLYSLAIPPVFIFLKQSNIALVSSDLSQIILDQVAIVDPAIRQHASLLASLGRSVEATNYPVFIITMFSVLCIPIVLVCRIYASRWRVMLSPSPAGLALILMIAPLYYVLEFTGAHFATDTFHGSKRFYLDRFGFYYFYEAMLLFLYAVALLLAVISLLHTFSAGWRVINRLRSH